MDGILDPGGGALLVNLNNRRIDREGGEVVWKAWPTFVLRVLAGRLVFCEGYIDRRQAYADYGVELA